MNCGKCGHFNPIGISDGPSNTCNCVKCGTTISIPECSAPPAEQPASPAPGTK